MWVRRLQQRGDTIVEVLIAITVVSLMIGGAYVASNRSLNNGRQAQERGEALKVTETQLERLKGLVATDDKSVFTTADIFCIDGNNTVQSATSPANTPDDLAAYQDACRTTSGGAQYHASIQRSANNQFTVIVRWEGLGSTGREQTEMKYRVYEPNYTQATTNPANIPPSGAPAPSGTLTCTATSYNSIRLTFSHENTSIVTLFRDGTPLLIGAPSPGTYNDNGRSPLTSYTYRLVNGIGLPLAEATCTTPTALSGSISCSHQQFVGMHINYSHNNASSPSIWRDGAYIRNVPSSPGSFTDTDSSVQASGQNFTYYLRNGQSSSSPIIASATCYSQPFVIDWGNICFKGC